MPTMALVALAVRGGWSACQPTLTPPPWLGCSSISGRTSRSHAAGAASPIRAEVADLLDEWAEDSGRQQSPEFHLVGQRREPRSMERVVLLRDGSAAVARAVVIATGISYRRLGVPAAEALVGAGVFYGSVLG